MPTPPPFDPDDPFRSVPPLPAPPQGPDEGVTLALGAAAPRPPAVPLPLPPPSAPTGRIPGLDFSAAPPDVYVPGARPEGGAEEATVALGTPGFGASGPAPVASAGSPAPGPAEDDGRTVAYFARPRGHDPVVGWLVCVDGPDKGRDFRLHAGRNFVGRAEGMHVALTADPAVSRDKHCIVVFDPRARAFRVAPGESAALTYLNGASVDVPASLSAFDRIEVGASSLLFVPLCGDRFSWESDT